MFVYNFVSKCAIFVSRNKQKIKFEAHKNLNTLDRSRFRYKNF